MSREIEQFIFSVCYEPIDEDFVREKLNEVITQEVKKATEGLGKEFLDRCKYFYMKTDGTYDFPNSREGDLIRIMYKSLKAHKEKYGELHC